MTRMAEVLTVLVMMILFPTDALGEEVMIDWDARRVTLGHEENYAFCGNRVPVFHHHY